MIDTYTGTDVLWIAHISDVRIPYSGHCVLYTQLYTQLSVFSVMDTVYYKHITVNYVHIPCL